VVLSETGSDHLHVIADGSQPRGRAVYWARQPHPVSWRSGGGVAIKTGAFDLDATAVRCRCQAKVVDRIAKLVSPALLFPAEMVGQYELKSKA
jgi:hypothetical protein